MGFEEISDNKMEEEPQNSDNDIKVAAKPPNSYKNLFGALDSELRIHMVIFFGTLHLATLWTFIKFPYLENPGLFLWGFALTSANLFGITAGVHRLWSHRCYRAALPLRIILMIFFSAASQDSIVEWVLDHRVHHKYTETDADPHNSRRGLFFSHVGWLMMQEHPEVTRRRKEVDASDVLSDPVVQFQEKYFYILKMMLAFVIPTCIPPLLWNADWFWSLFVVCAARYCVSLNIMFSVNSIAHAWGYKSYDKNISPTEQLGIAILTYGEGWHNYHHTFPWDYKASEIGRVNVTTMLLDLCSKIGWAYDLKSPSNDLIKRVVENRGDGTHPLWGHEIPETMEKKLLNGHGNNRNFDKIK